MTKKEYRSRLEHLNNWLWKKCKDSLRNKLVFDKIILEKEAELINLDSILKFTESDLYNEIMSSDIIEKEKPFC